MCTVMVLLHTQGCITLGGPDFVWNIGEARDRVRIEEGERGKGQGENRGRREGGRV